MKPIDSKIKYYELIMKYDDTSNLLYYSLPDKYHFEYYKSGDENDWVEINLSGGNFTSHEEGEKTFHDFFDSFIDELDKRCIFIVDNLTKRKVATATVSLLKKKENGCNASIDWVAVDKEYQRKGLSKPLITACIDIAYILGHKSIILHTQTTTWLAANIYLNLGFKPVNIDNEVGWRILKTITNNKALDDFEAVDSDFLYDKRNVLIEKKLSKIYKTYDFNYSVWYKNNLHNVYVYCNGKEDEYLYYYENDSIRLEKI